MIEKALAYVTSLDPAFPDRIQGSPEDEILAFESLVGKTLPASYREFLKSMGRGSDGIHIGIDCDAKASTLIDFYKDEIKTGVTELPENVLVMALWGSAVPMLWLRGLENPDPSVIAASGSSPMSPFSDSIGNMICQAAFYKFRLPALTHRYSLTAPGIKTSIMVKCREVASNAGLESLFFADGIFHCCENGTTAIAISDQADIGRTITLGSTDQEDLLGLIARFKESIPFDVKRLSGTPKG